MRCPFNLRNKKQVIKFDEVDPYNPQNKVRGYINRRQGKYYGALYITHVNKKPQYQLVHSAPKQHYPFDKDRVWNFPEYDYVELYEKLDGTCIINYNYHTNIGWFTTYKTRLRPFLGSSRYGDFFSLWNEMLEKYPNIKEICRYPQYHYIFEIYGKRNKILIDYDVPLDTKCIFLVKNSDGTILSPNNLDIHYMDKVPLLNSINSLDKINEVVYTNIQNDLEEALFVDHDNKILKGMEGIVMYFIKDNITVQIKNKPPSVLKYHWSGDAISYESIYTTVVNSFENFDNPTYTNITQLLSEEFEMDKIEKSKVRITKVLGKVTFDKKFQHTLADDYNKLGIDINDDKVSVMRWFGSHYPKSESKRIYRMLMQYQNAQ